MNLDCPICGAVCQTLEGLNKHLDVSHSNDESPNTEGSSKQKSLLNWLNAGANSFKATVSLPLIPLLLSCDTSISKLKPFHFQKIFNFETFSFHIVIEPD